MEGLLRRFFSGGGDILLSLLCCLLSLFSDLFLGGGSGSDSGEDRRSLFERLADFGTSGSSLEGSLFLLSILVM